MKVSENTSVAMPIKNMIGIIIGVSMGIFAYTEITARLTSLETSRELMNADLLKASEQTTVDKEQFILIEDLYKTTDEHTELLNKNNQVDGTIIAFWRMFFAAAILWSFSVISRQGSFKVKKNLIRSVISGFFLGIHFALFFIALDLTKMANAAF